MTRGWPKNSELSTEEGNSLVTASWLLSGKATGLGQKTSKKKKKGIYRGQPLKKKHGHSAEKATHLP